MGEIEKLRQAREAMNEIFPLTPAMWQEWARDEASISTGPEALLGVGKIYERGVSDYLVKKIFEFLKNGFHEISSSLDLSFEYDLVADEKNPFLAYLTSVLEEHSFFPYEPPAGSKRFRNLIADFMKIMLSFLQELCGNCECSSIVFTSPRTSNQTLTEAMVNKFSNQGDDIFNENYWAVKTFLLTLKGEMDKGRSNTMSAELEHVNAHLENG